MNRLQRLYMRELVMLFFSLLVALSILFSAVSVIENLDELARAGLKGRAILVYALLRVPEFMKYLFPMGLLLSVIFVFSLASRRREITILKASGQNLKLFFLPFLIFSLLTVVANILIAEALTPYCLDSLRSLMRENKGAELIRSGKNGFWLKGRDGSIVHARVFFPERALLKGVSVFYLEGGRLKERLEAESALWKDNDLILKDVWIYRLIEDKTEYAESYSISDAYSNELIGFEKKRLEDMGVIDLMRYNRSLKEAGYRNIKLEVDIHSRLSYPITNIFMFFIGLVVSLKSQKGRGIVSAGVGVLLSLVYWFMFSLFLSLGYASVLHPVLAGWIVPVTGLALGLYGFYRLPS